MPLNETKLPAQLISRFPANNIAITPNTILNENWPTTGFESVNVTKHAIVIKIATQKENVGSGHITVRTIDSKHNAHQTPLELNKALISTSGFASNLTMCQVVNAPNTPPIKTSLKNALPE